MLGGHRCFITHLSTIVPDQMTKALDAVVKYVENNIQCEHIRVEINHYKDVEGNLKVDNFVKTVYTNKGFRWKTLINDPVTGKRA